MIQVNSPGHEKAFTHYRFLIFDHPRHQTDFFTPPTDSCALEGKKSREMIVPAII
jgi:hypothetical protein